MVTNTCPPKAAYVWLRGAFAILRAQPLFFMTAVLAFLSMLAMGNQIPFVGTLLAAMMQPFGAAALCAWGEASVMRRPMTMEPLASLWRFLPTRTRMLKLGIWFALFTMAINLVIALLTSSAMRAWAEAGADPATLFSSMPMHAYVIAAILYVPTIMCSAFSPMLVARGGMTAGKALFISFFACWRNRGPFVALALGLAAYIFAAGFAAMLAASAANSFTAALFILSPASFLAMVVLHGMIWPMWWTVFVADGQDLARLGL